MRSGCTGRRSAVVLLSLALHALALLAIGLGLSPQAATHTAAPLHPLIEVVLLAVAAPPEVQGPSPLPSATPSRAHPPSTASPPDPQTPSPQASATPLPTLEPVQQTSLSAQPTPPTHQSSAAAIDLATAQASSAPAPRSSPPSFLGARPDYAYNPPPNYPLLLREQGVGGVVWLRVWVDSDGRPGEIRLAQGSGYRLLDDAALHAVRHWRFIPAKNGDQAQASWVEFPVRFTLNS